jgi:arylsulfatase A-like enzyme
MLFGWPAGSVALAADTAPEHPNVLFIAIDDLRDWVHYLGVNQQVRTPNLDRLAARGLSFTHSYCAAPVCNPSRTALMSGLRPWSTGVYGNAIDWRPAVGQIPMLSQYFMQNGYYVAGAGKIYHGGYPRLSDWHDYLQPEKGDPKLPKGADGGVGGIRFAPLDCDDKDLVDYASVSYTLEQLRRGHDKPFFLACGLHKPHMPWNVPRKYYDMYPLEQIQLPKVLEHDLGDIPPSGVKMAKPDGDHAAMVRAGRWKDAVQGYLAAITFADAMIGRLMDGFDQSQYAKNTIVVLWCDHGWHLGEKEHWRKFALWEEATRSPLIFAVPGMTRPGTVCNRTVDFMSIYPTLADLCGLSIPQHVAGPSLRPLLANPDAAWDRPAITTHGYKNHAVRTERWRYIRYANGDEELYDHQSDPHEWTNLAGKPEFSSTKAELARWLPTNNAPEAGKGAGKQAKADKKAKKAKKK